MERREFLAGLVFAAPTVAISAEMKYSSPQKIVGCWSGWRESPANNRICAWFTGHYPEYLREEGSLDLFNYATSFKHYASMVCSSRADLQQYPVGGYQPGAEFNTYNCILLEELPLEILSRLSSHNRNRVFDDIFAKEKKRALDELVKYMIRLVPVTLRENG